MPIKLKYLIIIIMILIIIILLATIACFKAAGKADNWEQEINKRKSK